MSQVTDEVFEPPSTGGGIKKRGSEPVISLKNVVKEYLKGSVKITALDDISIDFFDGEFVTIQGPSGCGKTTLLNMISSNDKATSGKVFIKGKEIGEMNDDQQSEFRAMHVGFVFQFYNLIDHETAIGNVMMAIDARNDVKGARKIDGKEKERIAMEILGRVGLGDRLYNTPSELSGGEQQRVAIARALVKDPAFIIADEPTGDLDTEIGAKIIDLFKELNEKDGVTIIIVTHNPEIGAMGKRRVRMKNYKIVSDVSGSSQIEESTGILAKPTTYLPDPKIDAIKELLVTDNVSIQDIASIVGVHVSEKVPLANQQIEKIKELLITPDNVSVDDIASILGISIPKKVFPDQQMSKIKQLLSVSDRINIQDVADIIGAKRSDVIEKIMPIAKDLKIQISGDVFIVDKNNSGILIDELEKQFGRWDKESKI